MLIGEVSRATGLSCKAIRLYEELGLIRPARAGRYRHFSAADLELLLLIREARQLQIPLQRLRTAIGSAAQPDWQAVRTLLLTLRHEIHADIARQQQRLQQLQQCLSEISGCPLLQEPPPEA